MMDVGELRRIIADLPDETEVLLSPRMRATILSPDESPVDNWQIVLERGHSSLILFEG